MVYGKWYIVYVYNVASVLTSEDINSSEVALGVSVLAGLGSGHVSNLARVTLDADISMVYGASEWCVESAKDER